MSAIPALDFRSNKTVFSTMAAAERMIKAKFLLNDSARFN